MPGRLDEWPFVTLILFHYYCLPGITLTKKMRFILGREGAAVEAFENTLGYSSKFGKLWYLTVAFRVMITVLVGTSLYANHESTFQ